MTENKIKRQGIRENSFYQELGLIKEAARDILRSKNIPLMRKHIQHGSISVHRHCVDVALASVKIKRKFNIKCSEIEMIRGALLHDYFLYDWHTYKPAKREKLHGFTHAAKALENATHEYILTPKERDIIQKHMWPLNLKAPKCKEAWIVTIADKYCSLMETLHLHRRLG